jgi:hypothetical protein
VRSSRRHHRLYRRHPILDDEGDTEITYGAWQESDRITVCPTLDLALYQLNDQIG